MAHATGTMKNAIGIGKPGEPVNNRPHLGDLILQKYEGILHTGFEDLKRFELIDRLENDQEKPVLDFFWGVTRKRSVRYMNFFQGIHMRLP